MVSKVNLNRIKSVLAEKNKSSKELASHLDKTESTVSRWCTNEVQPTIETLYEISKFLKVDIRELLVSTVK
ncbi:MAG TPA: helix-turn-helix transcriptional regulator [Bacteroidia bacterium]